MKHDWEYKKLGEVCESELGKTLNQSKDSGNLRPYLCAINIQWDTIDLSTIKQARFEDEEVERYSVEMGDLLICEGGDTGRAAIWNGTPMLYQNALHRVRFNSKVTARFALMYLRYLKNIGEIDSKYSKGVTIKHLVKSSLMSIPIPIPPLPIQQQIVAELDKVSEIIEKKKQQVKELDNLAQSIFYDMFGDPVENEKGWEVKKYGEVFIIGAGGTPSKSKPEYWEGGNIPWIGSNMCQNQIIYQTDGKYITDEGLSHSSAKVLEEGTVLVALVGATIGKVGLLKTKTATNQNIAFVKVGENLGYNPYFVFYQLQSLYGLFMSIGNGDFKMANQGFIKDLPIITPPLPLQQSFAQKVEAIERQKELITASIKEAQLLFDARMDYWFGE